MVPRRVKDSALKVSDDRGRSVPLFVPAAPELLMGTPPSFKEDEFRRIRRRIVGSDSGYGATAALMALFSVVLAMYLLFRLTGTLFFDGSWWGVVKTGIWLVVVATFAELMFRGYGWPGRWWWLGQGQNAQRWSARVRQAFLDERRCPSCGYSLGDLAAQPDGCTVCPECGAAWRLGAAPPR
jgi:hypothetical protein